MYKNGQLPKPFFILAPMDDVTDTVFRQVVADCAAPDMYFTEFVNVDGLQSPGRPKLLKKLKFVATETNLVAQLWGLDQENFCKTAQEIADGSLARELGLPEGCNFTGIDLNMGCPAKSEVSNGTCSALILNRPLAHEIIEATKSGVAGRLPVSVKTRTGFHEVDMTWISFLLEHDLAMLTLHGRTRKEMSKVPANWELIGEARKLRDEIAPKTLIVGNGDVESREHGMQLAQVYELDGIMIGRGVFHDPFLFGGTDAWAEQTPLNRLSLYTKHVKLFADTWQNRERPVHTLNKFCKVYVNGFEGARELRDSLMQAQSTDELLDLLNKATKAQ